MEKEAYVSFEVAKLFKQKGFDWECCNHFYCRKEDGKVVERWMQFPADRNSDRWINKYAEYVSAPTQQMACSWLREEKGLFIGIYPEFGDVEIAWRHGDYEETLIGYRIKIVNLDYCEVKHDFLVKDSYENAIEEGLKYCLTELL